MRVAMLLDWFFPYATGVANALAGEARILMVTRDHGHELGVTGDSMSLRRSLLDDRVQMLIVGGRQRDVRSLLDVAHVRQILRRFAPDVLHVQDHSDWRLYALQRSTRVPTLLTIHDVVFHEGEKLREGVSLPLRRHILQSVRSRPDGYVVHGKQLAETLRAQKWYREQPIDIIPHGRLPFATSCLPLPSKPTILFFGRLEFYKGLDLLIDAAELAAQSIPNLRVIIAGQGPDAARCRGLVRSPGLFDWRLGFVPNEATAALFGEASVVVLPYRDASQSGVVPLAFANHRPVIATDVGALSEAIADERNGLLVRENTPEAVAEAIVRVFAEDGLLSRLASGASQTVTAGPMTPSNIADLHMSAYSQLLRRVKAR